MNNARSIIAFHNHLSSDPFPSQTDISLTTLLKYAGDILKIRLIDHIIIADERFVSLKQYKML